MTTSRLMAGASRFAHFAGLSRSSARRAAEDDDQHDDDGAGAEDDDEDGEEDDAPAPEKAKGRKGRKARRAEENDDGEDDEARSKGKRSRRAEDDEDEDDEPAARGKKSRRAEDDDDEDAEEDDDKQEMTGRSAAAQARRRERARCAAIFAHRAAVNNVPLAASLAFDTSMTRQEAIAVMKGQAGRGDQEHKGNTSRRADRNPNLGASHGSGESPKPKAGSSWDRSFKKLGIAPR